MVLRRHASLSGEARGQSCVFRRWLWPSGGEGQGNPVKRENSAGPARSTGEEGGGERGKETGSTGWTAGWKRSREREKPLLLPFLMIESRAGQDRTSQKSVGKRLEHSSPTEAAVPKSCGHSNLLCLYQSLVCSELWPQTGPGGPRSTPSSSASGQKRDTARKVGSPRYYG